MWHSWSDQVFENSAAAAPPPPPPPPAAAIAAVSLLYPQNEEGEDPGRLTQRLAVVVQLVAVRLMAVGLNQPKGEKDGPQKVPLLRVYFWSMSRQ